MISTISSTLTMGQANAAVELYEYLLEALAMAVTFGMADAGDVGFFLLNEGAPFYVDEKNLGSFICFGSRETAYPEFAEVANHVF